jgi:myo-inositol-1(or 4)-monophosphatase
LPVTDPHDYAALAQELGAALRAAGPIAMRTFRGDLKSWIKGHNSPVTEADIAVDQFLRDKLSRPDFGWLSEESKDDRARLQSDRIIIVDPIDGTRSYMQGRPDWSIVAAVVENGRPVAAGVYVPVEDNLYLAAAGLGATRNGTAIRASTGSTLAEARIAGPKNMLDRISAIDRASIQEPKIHSLALRMTRVAEGRIDAAFASVNAYDWDLAAADLLVHEAGGVMTYFSGERLVYNLHDPVHGAVIAAGHERHALMLDIVKTGKRAFA